MNTLVETLFPHFYLEKFQQDNPPCLVARITSKAGAVLRGVRVWILSILLGHLQAACSRGQTLGQHFLIQ